MKQFITILLICFSLMGCSLIPKLNFNTENTVPQVIDKSKAKNICKGKATFNDNGDIISCSKNYYSYAENYEKKERRMTIVERIKGFINNLVGWSFWIFVGLIIFCPSAIGFIFGRIMEAVGGIGKKALNATVRAVQKVRKNGANLNDALSAEQDDNIKKYIAKLKDEEKIK